MSTEESIQMFLLWYCNAMMWPCEYQRSNARVLQLRVDNFINCEFRSRVTSDDSAEIGTAYYQYKRVYYDLFSFYNRVQESYDMLRRNGGSEE